MTTMTPGIVIPENKIVGLKPTNKVLGVKKEIGLSYHVTLVQELKLKVANYVF
jgi:hypothetical protein